jgi:hypothetical protein
VPNLINGVTYSLSVRSVNIVGTSEATSSVSVRPLPPAPSFVSAPRVYGPLVVGGTLTCDVGQLSPTLTYTYTWSRGTSAIAGATTRTYVVKSVDLGKTLSCGAVATNLAGSLSRSAPATTAVLRAGTTATKKPAITPATGVRAGSTLTCSRGTWSATASDYIYRFVLNSTLTLAQGSSSTYRVTAASSAGRVTCEVYASNRIAKYGGFATSAAVSVS